jgi:hypothetical protein
MLSRAYRERSRPFGLALAQEIFTHADRSWSPDEVSRYLGVTVRDLRMRLFREDYGFASTVRRCRALQLFLSGLCYDFPHPSAFSEFRHSTERMDSMLADAFSVRFSTLSRIRLHLHPR